MKKNVLLFSHQMKVGGRPDGIVRNGKDFEQKV